MLLIIWKSPTTTMQSLGINDEEIIDSATKGSRKTKLM